MARAVDHEHERAQLNRYLDDLDEEFGPVPEELIEGYDAQWPMPATSWRTPDEEASWPWMRSSWPRPSASAAA